VLYSRSILQGTFTKVSADVKHSPSDHSHCSIDVRIDANSVGIDAHVRDKGVRGDRFLSDRRLRDDLPDAARAQFPAARLSKQF
jgi:polyisoprenoid-binding protein YceI